MNMCSRTQTGMQQNMLQPGAVDKTGCYSSFGDLREVDSICTYSVRKQVVWLLVI